MEYERFFAELTPRLEMARDLECELDRKLAHRFSVLDYLRDNELGLSRIIADLLNPKARHGQGPLFLQTLLSLEGLKNAQDWTDLGRRQISVVTERRIPGDRRIDISVHIDSTDEEPYCLAIENKPYAVDQESQVKDYLEYLGEKYDERFLLIYLSPTGAGPSEKSIHKTKLDEWKDRFAIMPYHEGPVEQADKFDAFRIPHSLADWFGKCRRNCEVDRLRWFLHDAQVFCQRTFGERIMTTDSETKAVRDVLLSNPENLAIARTVYESWPAIKEEICKKFLERLCRCVERKAREKMPQFADDIRVGWKYRGERRWVNCLWLYLASWTPYKVEKVEQSDSDRRTAIRLEADGKGPNGWCYGVSSPVSVEKMTDRDTERRLRLDAELKKELGYSRDDRFCRMKARRSRYVGHRFPPEVISHVVWLYFRFSLSLREVEEMLVERGIDVTYETIRQWSIKFGVQYARCLKRRQGRFGDTWHLDELFVSINGKHQYLWRAVDQDGDVIDILVQPRRDVAARRSFRRLLKSQRREPFRLVTDKLGSYRVAHRDVMPLVTHDTRQYANNRAEVSHQSTRQRERQMRRFKSPDQAQRFLPVHGVIQNLFRLGRHRLSSVHYRLLQTRSFTIWAAVTAA